MSNITNGPVNHFGAQIKLLDGVVIGYVEADPRGHFWYHSSKWDATGADQMIRKAATEAEAEAALAKLAPAVPITSAKWIPASAVTGNVIGSAKVQRDADGETFTLKLEAQGEDLVWTHNGKGIELSASTIDEAVMAVAQSYPNAHNIEWNVPESTLV